MASYNKVLLIGNLTRDPELKYLPSGTPVVEFGLATNRRWKDRDSGEQREVPTFVDCKTMGRAAEVIKQYMFKGSPIFIEGRLDFRKWQAKDGSPRSKLDVFVENFQFLGGGQKSGGSRGEASSQPANRGEAAGFPKPGTFPTRREEGQEGGGAPAMGAEDEVPF